MASSASSDILGLTPEQIAIFDRDGFLVLKDWIPKDQITALKAEASSFLDAIPYAAMGASVFTTEEQTRHSDEYFLGSGSRVRCFFENVKDADGQVIKNRQTVNKLGHLLHELLPEYKKLSFDSRIAAMLRSLDYEKPLLPQSMLICKNGKYGGAVLPHQDGTFLYTRPQSCIGFWWPFADCTQSNGCLWAVPGSHKAGVKRHFARTEDNKGTHFIPPEAEAFDLTGAVPLEIGAGSLVLLHGAVVHFSKENKSSSDRWAYSIHVVEGGRETLYPKDNWLQREDGRPFPCIYDPAPENPDKPCAVAGTPWEKEAQVLVGAEAAAAAGAVAGAGEGK